MCGSCYYTSGSLPNQSLFPFIPGSRHPPCNFFCAMKLLQGPWVVVSLNPNTLQGIGWNHTRPLFAHLFIIMGTVYCVWNFSYWKTGHILLVIRAGELLATCSNDQRVKWRPHPHSHSAQEWAAVFQGIVCWAKVKEFLALSNWTSSPPPSPSPSPFQYQWY